MKELNEKELKEIEGGSISLLGTLAVGVVLECWAAILYDWDNFKRGFNGLPKL